MKKKLSFLLALMFALSALLTGCGKDNERKETAFAPPDLTAQRILYQVELDNDKDAERYTTAVSTQGTVVLSMPMGGHILGFHNFIYGDVDMYDYCTPDKVYYLMGASIIPFKEEDGTVNDYVLYHLYNNDLSEFFAMYCDGHQGEEVTITWHYNRYGLRVIDNYDKTLGEEKYRTFWMENYEFDQTAPPILEIDLGIEALPTIYSTKDDAYLLRPIVEKMYPDVEPYGTPYPVSE